PGVPPLAISCRPSRAEHRTFDSSGWNPWLFSAALPRLNGRTFDTRGCAPLANHCRLSGAWSPIFLHVWAGASPSPSQTASERAVAARVRGAGHHAAAASGADLYCRKGSLYGGRAGGAAGRVARRGGEAGGAAAEAGAGDADAVGDGPPAVAAAGHGGWAAAG